jgi:hypothetical protein
MKMPKFSYWLIEKTAIYHEVDANDQDEANELVQDFLDSGLVDWGIGDMEVSYSFNGEVKDA